MEEERTGVAVRLLSMPRFFFDIHNDIEVEDEEGQLLPDLVAAREQATESAREMICEGIRQHGGVNLDHRIDVRNEAGVIVLTTTFREVFTITS